MAYRPGVIGRAIREGGAGIGRAISQLGEFRYRAARQEELDAQREEERRYRREKDEFSRFAKGASAVGNAQTIQEADALARVYKPHLGKYGPAVAALAAATPVPEGHARLPGVPRVTVRTPEFPGVDSGVRITPGRGPRDFRLPEERTFKTYDLEFPYNEEGIAEAEGLRRRLGAAGRAPPKPAGPAGAAKPTSGDWRRVLDRSAMEEREVMETDPESGATWGTGRFRDELTISESDYARRLGERGRYPLAELPDSVAANRRDPPRPLTGDLGRDLPAPPGGLSGDGRPRPDVTDPVAPAPGGLSGDGRLRPDLTDPLVLADLALARGTDPDDVLEALLEAGVPESEARRFVGR